ncbi:YceD family protein [Lactiplantibacillus carotarum]|uniref:YceD family protein n=1 Tax=Lactiplantibacillus carotarum TaxID=2993456 RepID=UPI00298ED9D3|nr:YceD family protein [Lactiplantibacillus carotarum]
MKWTLSQLKSYRETPLQFDEALDLKHPLMTRYAEIIDVQPVQVKGYVSYDKGSVLISATVTTTLTLPSSRSLTPVAVPLAFQMTEYYVPQGTDLSRFDEEEDTVIILPEDDILDFDVAVEDNILIHIPMQILSEAELNGEPMPTGQGWEVLSEDDLADQAAELKTVDPRLAKLKDLFPDQEDKD